MGGSLNTRCHVKPFTSHKFTIVICVLFNSITMKLQSKRFSFETKYKVQNVNG